MTARVGDVVLYRLRTGQMRRGQKDVPALVNGVNSDGTVDIVIFPAHLEIQNVSGVPPLSDRAGGHAWLPTSAEKTDEIADLRKRVEDLQRTVDLLLTPAPPPVRKPREG